MTIFWRSKMHWEKNSMLFFKQQNFSSLTEMNMGELMQVILLIQLYKRCTYWRQEYSSLCMTLKAMVFWPKMSLYSFYKTLSNKDLTTTNTAWNCKRNYWKLACKKSCTFWTLMRQERSSLKILFFLKFFRKFLSTKIDQKT